MAPLKSSLADKNPRIRETGAWALGGFGSAARPANRALVALLEDDDNAVRFAALESLPLLDTGKSDVIKLLLSNLAAGRFRDPSNLIGGLRRLDPLPPQAIPVLIPFLKHESEKSRGVTARVLGSFGETGAKAMPYLIKAAGDSCFDVRMEVAIAVWKISKSSKEALPIFLDGLKKKNRDVRFEAAFYLGEMGDRALKAVPVLSIISEHDEDELVKGAAKTAMARIRK